MDPQVSDYQNAVDPFEVKSRPKWHPGRVVFTLRGRWEEAESRRRFEAMALRDQPIEGLPDAPEVDWGDTDVQPVQLRYLLWALGETEALGGSVVEVGAYRGVTTACLAARTARPYVAVDPYMGYGGADADLAHLRRRTAGLNRFRHLRQTSGEAARGWDTSEPVSFVFIDAVHDYVNARFDLAAWLPFVPRGGMLAFHDTDSRRFAGVRRALFEASPPLELAAHVNDLVILRKP
jgi:predicted O-methyltransferase YrrM